MKQNLYKAKSKTQKNIHKNKYPQKKSQYNTKYNAFQKSPEFSFKFHIYL